MKCSLLFDFFDFFNFFDLHQLVRARTSWCKFKKVYVNFPDD